MAFLTVDWKRLMFYLSRKTVLLVSCPNREMPLNCKHSASVVLDFNDFAVLSTTASIQILEAVAPLEPKIVILA